MRTILAAVDQSHHAHDVMSRAAELAVLLRNDLVVLSVISSEASVGFLDHIDGLRRKVSSILRDDVESSLTFEHLELDINDLLDCVQDNQCRFDNFRAYSISRQYSDLVSLSRHQSIEGRVGLEALKKAFPPTRIVPWYSLITVDINSVPKAS